MTYRVIRFGLFFLLVLFVSTSIVAEEPRYSVRGDDAKLIPPRSFTFDQLLGLLADPGTTSVDDLVEKLPQGYRENYVEIYASRSPEKDAISAKTPRIVAYGDEAKVILSFFGDRAHRLSFQSVQICRFNDDAKAWEFYFTSVPPVKDGQGAMVPLEKNPARCLVCHGSAPNPPSPIRDSYFFWPGVFGSEDEELFRSSDFGNIRIEAKLRTQFLANKPSLRRYQLLREHVGHRYELDHRLQPDAMDEPNTTFGTLLNLRQSEAMARAIRQNPLLVPYRFAILGALTGRYVYVNPKSLGPYRFDSDNGFKPSDVLKARLIYPMSQFLPQGFPGDQGVSEEDLMKRLVADNEQSVSLRLERHLKLLEIKKPEGVRVSWLLEPNNPALLDLDRRYSFARLMFVIDNLGVPLRTWSLDRERLFANHDGMDTFFSHLERSLWKEWIQEKETPELFARFAVAFRSTRVPTYPMMWGGRSISNDEDLANEIAARTEVCDMLVEKSRQSLGLPPALPKEPTRP